MGAFAPRGTAGGHHSTTGVLGTQQIGGLNRGGVLGPKEGSFNTGTNQGGTFFLVSPTGPKSPTGVFYKTSLKRSSKFVETVSHRGGHTSQAHQGGGKPKQKCERERRT